MGRKIVTLPNLLTMMRIGFIPLFIVAFYIPYSQATWVCIFAFGIAAITDWLDGFIARTFGQSTAFGAFLDPVADKLIVIVALVLLVGRHATIWMTIPVALLISREIIVSALREWSAAEGRQLEMKVSWMGKVKTFVQMVAIFVFLYYPLDKQFYLLALAYACLYAALVLSLWSMADYFSVSTIAEE